MFVWCFISSKMYWIKASRATTIFLKDQFEFYWSWPSKLVTNGISNEPNSRPTIKSYDFGICQACLTCLHNSGVLQHLLMSHENKNLTTIVFFLCPNLFIFSIANNLHSGGRYMLVIHITNINERQLLTITTILQNNQSVLIIRSFMRGRSQLIFFFLRKESDNCVSVFINF